MSVHSKHCLGKRKIFSQSGRTIPDLVARISDTALGYCAPCGGREAFCWAP